MHDAHEFLRALTVVLCVAAVTTVIFQRLRQPVILGYILAGLIIGPHVPIPLVADNNVVRTLSEIGVILLMFSLGLEFSLRKLVQVGPTAALTAVVETSLMMWLGFSVAQLFGWTIMEGMFTGAIVAISSTTIVAKAFQEQKVAGRLREIVVGVLIVEDLIAILLMATLTAVASGSGLSPGPLAWTVGRLSAFLIGFIVVGLFLVPRAIRLINRLNRPETTIVASIGLCFALALLAQWFGYSVALGAFIAGSLVAESGEEEKIAHLVEPVRDIFAAVFFVSVGMLIDPTQIARHWREILVLTVVVVGGKIFGVAVGTFLTGNRLRTSVQAGMSLAQIGEFSFIIAGLGLALNATQSFLYPVAIVISALTTLTTPWLIRASGPAANWIDRRLPRALQTFTVLYGSWVESLRNAPRSSSAKDRIRRLLRWLLIDATLCTGILVGISSSRGKLAHWLRETAGIAGSWVDPLLIGIVIVLAGPFLLGVVRVGRKLGLTLAEVVLPAAEANRVDLAAAPRRLLIVTFELAIVVMVGAPMVAISRPLLPGAQGGVVVAGLIVLLGITFWRGATNLQGHVRAGAEVIVDVLARQSHGRGSGEEGLQQASEILPGLGALTAVRLVAPSPALGRTLADLNLRALTGASVLAITRAEGAVIAPSARDILKIGDVLALTGTQEAIAAACALLHPNGTAD